MNSNLPVFLKAQVDKFIPTCGKKANKPGIFDLVYGIILLLTIKPLYMTEDASVYVTLTSGVVNTRQPSRSITSKHQNVNGSKFSYAVHLSV